jgi:hypothetical protein
MEYHGKLYGKIGNKYFDTGKTSKDFDEMFEMLKDVLSGIREDNFMVTENEIEQLLTKITQ